MSVRSHGPLQTPVQRRVSSVGRCAQGTPPRIPWRWFFCFHEWVPVRQTHCGTRTFLCSTVPVLWWPLLFSTTCSSKVQRVAEFHLDIRTLKSLKQLTETLYETKVSLCTHQRETRFVCMRENNHHHREKCTSHHFAHLGSPKALKLQTI